MSVRKSTVYFWIDLFAEKEDSLRYICTHWYIFEVKLLICVLILELYLMMLWELREKQKIIKMHFTNYPYILLFKKMKKVSHEHKLRIPDVHPFEFTAIWHYIEI